MKKPRFTDEQMVTILREAKTKPVPDVAKKHASALGGGLPKLPVSKDLAAGAETPEVAGGHRRRLESQRIDTWRIASVPKRDMRRVGAEARRLAVAHDPRDIAPARSAFNEGRCPAVRPFETVKRVHEPLVQL